METFRVEVGHANQVKPGNLVGAIANETGISGAQIGQINIYDDYSTVDLPVGMPTKMFHDLKRVWVVGRQLDISRLREERTGAPAFEAKKKAKKPKKAKRKVSEATA